MVATESQDVLSRRFVRDFASVVEFFNTLLESCAITPRQAIGSVAGLVAVGNLVALRAGISDT